MNAISVLGMLVLLGVAWAISCSRWDVKLKPVLWGIGLQFLLALIIMRHDYWSFVGMLALAVLIISYIFSGGDSSKPKWRHLIAVGPAIAIGGGLAYLAPSAVIGWLWITVLGASFLSIRFRPLSATRKYLTALVVALGCAWLISRQVYGHIFFEYLSTKVTASLSLSDYGAKFLFGNLAVPRHYGANPAGWPGFGFQFAFKVLPTIVFFAALTEVLYYLGIMKIVIESIGRFMRWTIGTSGAETRSFRQRRPRRARRP